MYSMYKVSIVLFLFLVLGESELLFSQATKSWQPDSTGVSVYISSANSTTNYDTSGGSQITDLFLKVSSSDTLWIYSLWDSISAIPYGSTIDSAKLSLYLYNIGVNDTIDTIFIYRSKYRLANEKTIVWDSIGGINGVYTDKGDTITDINIDDDDSWIYFDVTTLTNDIYTGDSTNNGFVIVAKSGNNNATGAVFYSDNYNTVPERRPRLDIYYTPTHYAPYNVSATVLSDSSVALEASDSNFYDIDSVKIYSYKSDAFIFSVNTSPTEASQTFYDTLYELSPDYMDTVIWVSFFPSGDTTASPLVVFRTFAQKPSVLNNTTVSSSEIGLRFPSDDNPTSVDYAIYFLNFSRFINISGDTLSQGDTAWDTRSAWDSVIVDGLSPDSAYWFIGFVSNSDSVRSMSDDTTLIYTIPDYPDTVSIVYVDSTSLKITINSVFNNKDSTKVVVRDSSRHCYINKNGDSLASPIYYTIYDYDTVTISGLSPNTKYMFRAKALSRRSDSLTSVYGILSDTMTLAASSAYVNFIGNTDTSALITINEGLNISSQYPVEYSIYDSTIHRYINDNGDTIESELYKTAALWDTVSIRLYSDSVHYLYVKCRNYYEISTDWGKGVSIFRDNIDDLYGISYGVLSDTSAYFVVSDSNIGGVLRDYILLMDGDTIVDSFYCPAGQDTTIYDTVRYLSFNSLDTFVWRVYTNFGSYEDGSLMIFRTYAKKPSGLILFDSTYFSAKLSIIDSSGNDSTIFYGVRDSIRGKWYDSTGYVSDDYVVYPLSSWGDTITLYELRSGEQNYINVYSANSDSVYFYSTGYDSIVTLSASAPYGFVMDSISDSRYDSTLLVISWKDTVDEGSLWEFVTSSDSVIGYMTDAASSDTTDTLFGLCPATEYIVRIKRTDPDDSVKYSNYDTMTTDVGYYESRYFRINDTTIVVYYQLFRNPLSNIEIAIYDSLRKRDGWSFYWFGDNAFSDTAVFKTYADRGGANGDSLKYMSPDSSYIVVPVVRVKE